MALSIHLHLALMFKNWKGDGRMILKWDFKKWDGEEQIGFIWPRIGTVGRLL
jgi:hypothetical protein